MKKYSVCLLLFLGTGLVCFLIGFVAMKNKVREERENTTAIVETTETVAETPVINQREIEPVVESEEILEKYYLVSETGYLLVFTEDRSQICLYTHIPITDFPESEQERLREGIWFATMMEIFHYLESYTS